jgi:hypothetical protein
MMKELDAAAEKPESVAAIAKARALMASDRTQVARIVLGLGPLLIEMNGKNRDTVQRAKARLVPGS